MSIQIEGRVRLLGDNISTDHIIQSRRKRETIDPEVLKQWLLETVSPDFAASVRPGDLLVAGRNFGCGSAMEVAVTVPLASGIEAVLARSFARSYFRNAINNGLLPVECETSNLEEGERIRVVVRPDDIEVVRLDGGRSLTGSPLPGRMLDILRSGGLVEHIRQRGCPG